MQSFKASFLLFWAALSTSSLLYDCEQTSSTVAFALQMNVHQRGGYSCQQRTTGQKYDCADSMYNGQYPSLLLLGETGAGKSWFGNALLGNKHNSADPRAHFVASASGGSHTQLFKCCLGSWGESSSTTADGDFWAGGSDSPGKEFLFNVIDSPGMADNHGNTLSFVDGLRYQIQNKKVTKVLFLVNGDTTAARTTVSCVNSMKALEYCRFFF